MSEVLLFGAGASVDAGLPDARGLTSELLRRTEDMPHMSLLKFVVGGLLFARGAADENPLSDAQVDIEAVCRSIEWLERRERLETTSFVTGWHPRLGELERISGHGRNVYRETISQILKTLRDILWVKGANADYLAPLVKLLEKQGRVVVATLNYDNVVEQFCEAQGIECTTGLPANKGHRPGQTYELEFSDTGVNLVKLHGSLNWGLVGSAAETVDSDAHAFVMAWRGRVPDSIRPAVLFGGDSKLTAIGPFLNLLIRLDLELRNASVLTTVGYSFRDHHINSHIASFMALSKANCLRVVDPNCTSSDFPQLLVKKYGERVEHVQQTAAEGFQSFYG